MSDEVVGGLVVGFLVGAIFSLMVCTLLVPNTVNSSIVQREDANPIGEALCQCEFGEDYHFDQFIDYELTGKAFDRVICKYSEKRNERTIEID